MTIKSENISEGDHSKVPGIWNFIQENHECNQKHWRQANGKITASCDRKPHNREGAAPAWRVTDTPFSALEA